MFFTAENFCAGNKINTIQEILSQISNLKILYTLDQIQIQIQKLFI